MVASLGLATDGGLTGTGMTLFWLIRSILPLRECISSRGFSTTGEGTIVDGWHAGGPPRTVRRAVAKGEDSLVPRWPKTASTMCCSSGLAACHLSAVSDLGEK